MLTSRQPIWVGWGPQLVYLYNDPYKAIIGGKHPWALGQPVSVIWQEIWDDIAPMLSTAMGGTEGTYVEEQLLIMERNGYPEETYYTFSYSPVSNGDGTPGGIICANSDDTSRVIGERQMALLRELAAGTANARSWRDAGIRSAEALATNPRDVLFALLFLEERHGSHFVLAGAAGMETGHAAAPASLSRHQMKPWSLGEMTEAGASLRIVDDLQAYLGCPLPTGAWKVQANRAAVLPILPSGTNGRAGALIVGLNPYRLFDDSYRGFLELAANQISAALANAEAYDEERRRAEALAELDRAKTLIFSNVSHEFRTPLMLMLGPVEEMLADSELSARDHTRAEVVHRNGMRLLKLVNALLDFSRIEAGRAHASYQPTDLAAFTTDLVSNFRSATEKAGLSLTVDCSPLPEPVYVDHDMWEKIVLNLVSNAFKFTHDGGIAVSLQVDEGPAGQLAVMRVKDTGIGIPAAELPRLFERFHRIEGARGRSFEGSGIGLALVQELVKLHGGSIKVTSEGGRATEFTVRIPFGTAHLPEKSIHADREATSSAIHAHAYVEEALRWLPHSETGAMLAHEVASGGAPRPETQVRAKILLADDNADVRDYVRRLLGDRHDITAVADGAEALKRLSASRPDLVLTDIMMPRIDGLTLIREIREHAEWRDLPVIVLSARAGAEDSVVGLAAGADDYLVKPFASRELIARVDGALKLAGLRRQMNEALRQSEARFRNMADHAPIMIWTTDPSGACTYLSRSWSEFTGQAVGSGLGRGWLGSIHPDDREATAKTFFDSNRLHKAFNLETRFRTKAGDYRWVMGAAVPWLGTNDEFLGYIGSVIDITDRRQVEETQRRLNEILETKILEAVKKRELAEEKLLRAQKMEAVGKLTGGIAHDFNNLLQVIGGNLQLLQKDMAGNDKAEQRLRNAINGVSRGAKLASQLLAFGRRQPLAPKAVNLGRLVRGLDEILQRTLGEEIEIETVIAAGLWNTMVDPTHVENAILNLAINARDAMAGPGKLTIEVGNAYLDDDYALEYEITPGQFVMLAVSDTGSGMRPDVIEQAFEPFFTTKPEGQGTGLGLSMVYGFVKQSGGHIKIYSEIGQGTTIRMYLPRVRQDEDRPVGSKHRAVAGGSETILVVEDDDDVSATVVEMLTDLGYRVLKAKDAQSAFAIIVSGVGIDLLFTDVVMPGPMRSTELARKTRELSPATAILFTSGYTDNAIVHGGRLDEGVELLSKPYARETLARKVRQVLKGHNQLNGATQSVEQSMPPIQFNSVKHSASARSTRPTDQPLCVLAVEDDPLILMATTDMLEDMGLNVLQASSGQEALSRLAEKEVDVLMTDIGLPGMSGLELALEALSRQPSLRVIFMTGHSIIDGQDDHEQLQSAILLTKPFDERGLAAAIESARAGA